MHRIPKNYLFLRSNMFSCQQDKSDYETKIALKNANLTDEKWVESLAKKLKSTFLPSPALIKKIANKLKEQTASKLNESKENKRKTMELSWKSTDQSSNESEKIKVELTEGLFESKTESRFRNVLKLKDERPEINVPKDVKAFLSAYLSRIAYFRKASPKELSRLIQHNENFEEWTKYEILKKQI